MHLNIKAAVLSAFVIPGLGQLQKHHRVKGVILILLVNVFLLGALLLVLQGIGPLLLQAQLGRTPDPARLLASLQEKSPAARYLLALFFALWAYGVFDALVSPPGRKPEETV